MMRSLFVIDVTEAEAVKPLPVPPPVASALPDEEIPDQEEATTSISATEPAVLTTIAFEPDEGP